ncbi:peptide chain release factor N(5)-glutamine methyltransferase [Candidatus Solincola sp.]|nr:peptide chain release factor N(5)-glutamine methyltransferase [Actinomycetota bacterium]MDI7251156.1 peptide chain release factor N(5)-glutamine methyltransferase [Actinomycetota bacterium]
MNEESRDGRAETRPVTEIPALLSWAARFLERRGVSKPRLNAERLLSYCTGRTRVELYAYPERPLQREEMRAFMRAVVRRSRREPLQYITGTAVFRYLELAVDARVLIPRPETEMVVERALVLLRERGGHPVVVDVGTGSGCIALSLARECPAAVVHATDVDPRALSVARENACRLGMDGVVRFHLGDCLSALPDTLRGALDLVVSNPPYVREEDLEALPPEVREHEPRSALVAGPRGTEVHEKLLGEATYWLAPGGWLLMEGGEDQVGDLAGLARDMGYVAVRVHEDLNGRPRMVEARLTPRKTFT